MKKTPMIPINLSVAKELVRMLDKMQTTLCLGCPGESHEAHCPAHGAIQLRNYLTQRINNTKRDFTI